MVGGLLYSIGGYFLPFVTLGLLLFSTAIITLCILPKHNDPCQQGHSNGEFYHRIWAVLRRIFILNYSYAVSIPSLLRVPGVLVCAMSIMATSASIGFLGATLEPHLRQFDLGPILLGECLAEMAANFHEFPYWQYYSIIAGVVFIINGGIYALTAPIWGWTVDKCLNPKVSAFIGSLLIITAFCLIGPASFMPIEP